MGLFGKKKEIRFESITIDREKEIYRGLEKKGWTMIQDTFQFNMDKPPEKIRKMAMKMAKDLKGELLVEVWDPIYQRHPYKGLTYSTWRKMTPEEILKKRIEEKKKKNIRPDYTGSMGDASEMLRRESEERISQDDLKTLDEIIESQHIHSSDMEVVGDESGIESGEGSSIKAISAFDPMDHQGEIRDDSEAEKEKETPNYESAPEYGRGESGSGPVFEQKIKLETMDDIDRNPKPGEDFDAMKMMAEASEKENEEQAEEPEKKTKASGLPDMPPPPRRKERREGDEDDSEQKN